MTPRDLQRFRQRLMEMQRRLTGDLTPIVDTVLADAKACGEHDATVSETVSKELALESAEETIHRQVIEAIKRLDDGGFGICQRCQTVIPRERLEAVPYAPYCLRCESTEELRARP
jgi:RNA polymerase-binding transcription factor DksA